MMHKKIIVSIVFFLVAGTFYPCSFAGQSRSETVMPVSGFKRIAVLEQGRVKPMDSYARNTLLRFSGKRSFNREPAVEWLAKLLFLPDTTRNDSVFLINNPEILRAIDIEPVKRRRYSFVQLEGGIHKIFELAQSALKIEEKQRSIVEQEIIRVSENLKLYIELSHVMNFARPHPDFEIRGKSTKKVLNLPEGQDTFSFLDIALRAEEIEKATQGLETRDASSWNLQEREILGVLSNLYAWSLSYRNLPLHIVPAAEEGSASWLSPWDAIADGFQFPKIRNQIVLLGAMTGQYLQGDQVEFDLAARQFNDSVYQRALPEMKTQIKKTPLELFYNRLTVFLFVKFLYGLAFLVFICSLLSARPVWHKVAVGFIVLGFALHACGLVLRILILMRPPVSSLYETFLFVSFISVLAGIIIEAVNKKWLGVVVASVSGFILLLIASKYNADGDTLQMVIAVLNSNFWLGTHVLSITTGYAGCCVAGILGHVYIIQALTKSRDRKLLASTYKTVMGALGFGLIMSFLGTTLGGIWADQSWGRFWGWDPKENGALLIILWTAIIFHAKVGKMIGALGVAVMSVLGIIVVMWAWFGVNLLSVGLHSYGFTSGVAYGLGVYVVLQLLFLGIAAPIAKQKLNSHA